MASKKILIADDEPAIIEILKTSLAAAGYETCSARDGVEALEKVKSEKPDLIIMDVLMPRMTGLDAIKKIRENRELRGIPALMISAKGSMKDYFLDIPGVEFISKPYDSKELINKIKLLIGGQDVPQRGLSAVLIGVEDFLIGKIRTLFSSLNCRVLTALNEEDAFNQARDLHPNFILCQFWEEDAVLDPKKISAKLNEYSKLVQVPLYVYCKEELSLEAMKTFKGDRLITYDDSTDLVKKLGLLLGKIASH